MEAIIGEIRRDVPVFSEEEAFVAVLSEGGWNLTGGRRIIGLGMAFAVPTDAVIPESYRDMHASYGMLGDASRSERERNTCGYVIRRSGRAFYKVERGGCPLSDMEELFRLQDGLPSGHSDPERTFLLFFSHGKRSGEVGLRLPGVFRSVPPGFSEVERMEERTIA